MSAASELAHWQQLLAKDRGAFERAFLAATREERDRVLTAALERMTGEQRAACLERIQGIIDGRHP